MIVTDDIDAGFGVHTALAFGMFDGVHTAHAALIKNAVRYAEANGLTPAVFTFSNSPMDVLSPDGPHKLLTVKDEKLALFEALGVRYVCMPRFTDALASMPPYEFLSRIEKSTGCRYMAGGFNYRFGRGAAGDMAFMAGYAEKRGIACGTLPPVSMKGGTVSSSRIRDMLDMGDVENAAALLGREYSVGGNVVHGREIGRTIGFPTANILPPEGKHIPGRGVYAGSAEYCGKSYVSIINIGLNPTVSGSGKLSIEAHLKDFDGDIYGKDIRVRFRRRLRDEKKFDSLDALKGQLRHDIEEAARMY